MAWWDDVGKWAGNNWDKALYFAPGVGQLYGLADQATGGALGKGVREKTAQFGNWVTQDLPKDLGFVPSEVGSQFARPDAAVAEIPGYADMQARYAQGDQAAGARMFSPEIRGGQNQLASQLWGQVRGTEPSLAQAQLQKGTDANIAQAMAMARSQRGLGAAAQMRQIGSQRAMAGQQMAQDAGILRLQEQNAAQQQLSGLYNQMGTQDISQTSLNDQQVRFYLQKHLDLATAQQMARADIERARLNQENLATTAQLGENSRARQQVMGLLETAGQTAMGAATGGAGGAAQAGMGSLTKQAAAPKRPGLYDTPGHKGGGYYEL